MASWLMHLAIAKAVTKHLDLNVRKFNFGNLLPDASMQDPITKSKSHFRIEREPYEHTTTDNYQFFDYYRFLAKHRTKMQDDIYLGYFTHILTDELWIQNIYIKYMRDENRKKRLDQQANYYHDFDILNQIILEKYDLEIDIEVYEHQITEVGDCNLNVLIASLEKFSRIKHDDIELVLFNIIDIFDFIENTSKEIVRIIKRENLR